MKKTITDIKGIYANGINCGLKYKNKDLAFIYVPDAFSSAGVFTRNKFAAPCVHHTGKCIKKGTVKAVIINSGNANAETGEEGIRNTKKTAKLAASILGLNTEEVAVASTGIIGTQLPMEKMTAGIEKILADPFVTEGSAAAEAVLTTDTHTKEVYVEEKIGNETIRIAGISKGSGMLAPNMATTLTYLLTNAMIDKTHLQKLFIEVMDDTYNMTSVDTDTSTNDMALIVSTRDEGVPLKTKKDMAEFKVLLKKACIKLCKMIATDGEGATKLIEVSVNGAASRYDARKIAKNIVDSPLVKTAVHGADPNWGRVIAAAGKDPDIKLNPGKVELYFGEEKVLDKGTPVDDADRKKMIDILSKKKVEIILNLNIGKTSAVAWGCDLTKGYIDINTQYS
ncbi:MAG: bifunctional glutamate N-acetyltransferase/amino-acid acetyltransferase ArgJ [bacterium]|nr:bifunctional glutamate N-acetyltransferase/amino-acid acetyltransferase ArgJ [bacterium]